MVPCDLEGSHFEVALETQEAGEIEGLVPLVTPGERFHPSKRHWPGGMPDSIAETEHREPSPLSLVHVYCPNRWCNWHVRVDEKVREYNLTGHLLTCKYSKGTCRLEKYQGDPLCETCKREGACRYDGDTPRKPQEPLSRKDSPRSDGFSRTEGEALRTAPVHLTQTLTERWGFPVGEPDNFGEGKTSRPPEPEVNLLEEALAGGPLGQKTILKEAGELVDGPREAHYGHPADDFSRVIGAFNALFAEYLEKPLETRHWPLIMQLCKLSREIHEHRRDNLVDGAGYWRTLEKIFEREN